MSNNQWKVFQHSSDDLHQNSKPHHRNGNTGSEHTMSSMGSSSQQYMGSYSDNVMMGDSGGTFSSQQQNYDSSNHPPIRETGIIEKLLHSYGFIQCCERQARLFFHFSQFTGTIEHLKIGDAVEFEMTYDRRTGKPIASNVSKIAPEVVLSEARVTGTVTTEVKGEGSGDNTGRISYENRGECFFLPYTKDDVEGNVTLKAGDTVSFQIATNQRGNLGACHIRFENPAHPVKYHGVVCSMKESFGFIERADVVKEIFYHFTEVKSKEELVLGDDVEFIIQTRNGKEVACNITKMPSGSVVFEDVSPDMHRGQVLKSLDRGSLMRAQQNDPLPGRIRYRAQDHSEVEVPFGDKDQLGEFTMRHGDWVQFQIATDRRDHLRRACNISLLDESFHVSGERRERGVVCSLKEGFGFIRSAERELKLFFQFAEVLRLGQELSVGDEVEYTVDPVASFSNMKSRQTAIRIKHLPPGSVMTDAMKRNVCGIVQEETRTTAPTAPTATVFSQDPRKDESGVFQASGTTKPVIRFISKDKNESRDDDLFQIYHNNHSNGSSNSQGGPRTFQQGVIAALKDGFGFIETTDLSKEVFFHFSNVNGTPEVLELGREVEYSLGRPGSSSGGCASADVVRLLSPGSITPPRAVEPTLYGTVTRTLRALNPDQPQYSGLIQVNNGSSYEFGIMGLVCKREILQVGDPVTFQTDVEGRATNIKPIRKKGRATVDAIKGGFGFLTLDNDESSLSGKRLFFHMSEVRGNPNELQSGDVVEFVMITNSRNGKCSACNVVRISGKQPTRITRERPERLINRIRSTSLEDAPRVLVTRHPRGPDGTRGFRPRQPIADILKELGKPCQ